MKRRVTIMSGRMPVLKIEGARLILKNFQGKAKEFNEEGNRNFGVILDPELAERLEADGWNVKYLKPFPDDPDQIRTPWLSVKVKFSKQGERGRDPMAVLITTRGKIKLDEETIGQLDWTRMKAVDLVINPYEYTIKGGRASGISAYLNAIYVTVEEDDFYEKYGDIPFID